ncbi:hypothetical protein IWW45_009146 [Coemansia sp. RSA 485]|nr:hypothetical protein IWW45_009146 [Coemansia sp. RSA 485]
MSHGTARARVGITDGPKIWTWLTVVDLEQQPWELLMSSSLLEKLDIQLMTPAMRRHMIKQGRVMEDNSSFTLEGSADISGSDSIADFPTNADYEAAADAIASTDIDAVSKTD